MELDIDATYVYVTPAGDLRAILALSADVPAPMTLTINERIYKLNETDTLRTRNYLRKQTNA